MRSILRKLIIFISWYIAVSMTKMHLNGVTSFQLFAHFYGRCEVWKMRGRKNAKSTKCIAQHIPTQLRSFPTKIFLVNLRRKHALAFCTRFEHVRCECRQRIEAIKMRYRRLRLKNYTGLNLTEEKGKAFEKFRVRYLVDFIMSNYY